MTDITDQDRRDARAWAEFRQIASHVGGWKEESLAAARYILATVEAPAPTLADEVRSLAKYNGDVAPWSFAAREVERLAARAEQIEEDLAEQVEATEDQKRHTARIAAERDEACAAIEIADWRHWYRENNELRAEVKRLTAFTSVSDSETVTRYAKGGLIDKAAHEELDRINIAQKAAESSAESTALPDPADVKPGEAWLVEVNGKRGTAVKDCGRVAPWSVVINGAFNSRCNEFVTLVSRLVPAPRVITNADELDRAKRCTVIRDAAGVVCERDGMGDAWTTFNSLANQRPHIALPATVLWEPEA